MFKAKIVINYRIYNAKSCRIKCMKTTYKGQYVEMDSYSVYEVL